MTTKDESEMIECEDGRMHPKLPCIVCGRHAGGCLEGNELNPWLGGACLECEGALCSTCARIATTKPKRCTPCDRIVDLRTRSAAFGWGFVLGTALAFLAAVALGIGR